MFAILSMRNAAIAAVAGAGLMMSVGAASALTLTGNVTCSVTNVTIGGFNSDACAGAYDGNNSNQNLDGLFSVTGWDEIVKVDDPATSNTGGGIKLTVTGNGSGMGTWSVDTWDGYLNYMLVVKGGNSFSAYLIDITKGLSGTWNTQGVEKGNGQPGPGLSHLSLYTEGVTTPIPLPAAAWLLLAGLGGLGMLARRKTA